MFFETPLKRGFSSEQAGVVSDGLLSETFAFAFFYNYVHDMSFHCNCLQMAT